ncbi:MAG: hypothetical protein H6608_06525 [Flavobacteriales bacterium]|nr:hypothetical protein [Bacteroidota bacterium]MCB9240764.1 hypothetical protein [Flavobacteriales bacterium]
MKANQHIDDALIQDKLLNVEADYLDSDWEAMEALLDEKKPAVILPFGKPSSTQILMAIIMITTTILTLTLLTSSGTQPLNSLPVSGKSMITSTTPSTSFDGIAFTSHADEKGLKEKRSTNQTNPPKPDNDRSPVVRSSQSNNDGLTADPDKILPGLSKGDSSATTDTAEFYKKVVSRYWVDDVYKYVYQKPKYDMEQAWIGMHYTNQQNQHADMWDSIGRHRETHGFNLQFMTGNALKGEHLAIYGGVDWGMQFYGRSKSEEVVLNTTNGDKGLSYIRSHTNDLMIRAHVEYAYGRVVPYLTAGFGTRIFSNGQTIESLLKSTEFESSTAHGLLTNATKMVSYGAGARVHLTPRLSLDFRYEMQDGGNVNVINYAETSFNGLQYDIAKTRMNIGSGQFKWGIIVDLSEERREKVLEEEGHYEETVQELYLDKQDSEKVYIPCPCSPCPKKRTLQADSDDFDVLDENDNKRSTSPIFIPGGGGTSGGKSSFPGIKSPPIKN